MATPSFLADDNVSTQPRPAGAGLSALDLLLLVADRRRGIAIALMAALVAGVAVCVFRAPYYTATTTIMPPQQSSSSASSIFAQMGGMDALANPGGMGTKHPADLYVGLLQSNAVEGSMVHRFGLMQQYRTRLLSNACRTLEQRTKIDGTQKDGLVRISVTDQSPTRAAELASGYVEQLRRLSEGLAVSEASQRRLFLEQELGKTKDKLAEAEEDLKRTEETTGVIQVEGQARVLIESAANLRALVVAKEVEVQSIRAYAGESNVELIQAEQELAGLRAQLAKLSGRETSAPADLLPQRGQISSAGLEYVRKLREVKYEETIFGILAQLYESAKLDEAREGALIQVVDPALVPDHRSGPKRLLILISFLLLGLVLGMGYVLVPALMAKGETQPQRKIAIAALKQLFSLKG